MKLLSKTVASAALAGMVLVQPLTAQAATARAAAPVDESEQLHGAGGGVFGVLIAAAVIVAIMEVTGAIHIFSDDDHHPTSP